MRGIKSKEKKTFIYSLGFLLAAIIIQFLLIRDLWEAASILLLIGVTVALRYNSELESIKTCNREPFHLYEVIWIIIPWSAAIILRLHNLENLHIITDLNARFALTALKISRGEFIFPCIPQYEYDESLICWLYAPFFKLFGHSWLTVKTISVCYNSLLIPVAYTWLRKYFGSVSAFTSASLLAISGYFQKCDPMISMSRFTMVAIIIFILSMVLDCVYREKSSMLWQLLAAILISISLYLHSTGRMTVLITCLFGIWKITKSSQKLRSRFILKTIVILGLGLAAFIPFLIFVSHDPMYLYFKRRQIFGLHESFPFSWSGLWLNVITVFTNFNYRAIHHMHFSESFSLLRPGTAVGFIGFLFLTISRLKHTGITIWYILFVSTTVPLVIVTPGHWRGLYFSSATALVVMASGIFFTVTMENLFGFFRGDKHRSSTLFVNLCLMILVLSMGTSRFSSFYSGKFAPQKPDTVTRLLDDMMLEPDVPHYFDMEIPEMKPGFAIFEFIGQACFTRYGVMAYDPLRFMQDERNGKRVGPWNLGAKRARFVIADKNVKKIAEIHEVFGGYVYYHLKNSQLKMVEVKGEKYEKVLDRSGGFPKTQIRTRK